jgi:hypothetical protein
MNRFTVNNNNNSMEKLGEELWAAVALTTLGVPSHSNLIRHQQVPLPHHAPLSYMAMHQHQQQQQQHLSMISRKKTKTDNTRRNFAQKLFDVLESPYHTDVVKWLPGGKAFIVLDKRRFANEILPSYFKESQYTSFTRKLSRWKFTRVSRGPYMGAYYHKNFRRENRLMCKLMSCNNSKKSSDDDKDASVAPETAEDNDQIEADLVSTTPPPPETRRLPPNAPSQSDGTLEQAMSLQHTMHNTDNNILLIKQQIMEIRLRKARVEKRKQFLLMQAEAEARRLKEIQNIKNAMNMRIQQAENRIIAAAARALNRSNDINQTIMRNEILSYSPSWPPQEITTALPQTPQRMQHIDDTVLSPPETTSTSTNLLSSRAFAA